MMVTRAHPGTTFHAKSLVRQRANLHIWNNGPTIAIVMVPSIPDIKYWEILPGDFLYVHAPFPPLVMVGGNVEIEVVP